MDYDVIEATEGNDFQEYAFENGCPVPIGYPIGIEIDGKLFMLEHIRYLN